MSPIATAFRRLSSSWWFCSGSLWMWNLGGGDTSLHLRIYSVTPLPDSLHFLCVDDMLPAASCSCWNGLVFPTLETLAPWTVSQSRLFLRVLWIVVFCHSGRRAASTILIRSFSTLAQQNVWACWIGSKTYTESGDQHPCLPCPPGRAQMSESGWRALCQQSGGFISFSFACG